MRRNPLLISAGVLLVTVSAVIAVRYFHTYESPAQAVSPPAAEASGDPASADGSDGSDLSADPEQKARFDAATALVAKSNGKISIALRDRNSGAEWRAGDTTTPVPAAQTVKLAMATNLLERNRSGEIKLDTAARKQIADMLDAGSDPAADALWKRFGGDGYVVWFQQQYAMTGVTFAEGQPHNWSSLKGSPDDLLKLVSYVLERADQADRDYLTAELRKAGDDQHWGVWAAGADGKPGTVSGWKAVIEGRATHFVTNSVGFVGPDAQYAVVVTGNLAEGDRLDDGVQQVSDVVATVFGQPTPAQITLPKTAVKKQSR
jgi:hypothetical protein